MSSTSDKIKLPPHASRTAEGLRDTGYQLPTAISDIIDNSIEAEAEEISIFFEQDFRGGLTLEIFDDGRGMSKEELLSAMRYGAERKDKKGNLGKFGLGLKTASTAFADKLTVISRKKGKDQLYTASWDLDHIRKVNDWEMTFRKSNDSEIKDFEKVLKGKGGTLVKWDKCHRIFSGELQDGLKDKKRLVNQTKKIQSHLSATFQRFLDAKDKRARNIIINLNGEAIPPWDPFVLREDKTQKAGRRKIKVEGLLGGSAELELTFYILPREEEFSSVESYQEAQVKPANQGIYVYRENRLIHGPDWLGLLSRDTHYQLCRVEMSFDHRLDEAFQVDIKKSQIILNQALDAEIQEFLRPRVREGNALSRQGERSGIKKTSEEAHKVSNKNIETKAKEVTQPEIIESSQTKNTATIENAKGKVHLKISVTASNDKNAVYVKPADSIIDGLLWRPTIISENIGVEINRNHPYYQKVYVPNLSKGVTIQGMDSLLWGLSVSEPNCVEESTKRIFEDLLGMCIVRP